MINFIMTTLFVIFIIITVVGFNKQMQEKHKKRDDENRNIQNKIKTRKFKEDNLENSSKKDENESFD
ncbi:MAG: hypothetical protein GXZ15_03370 [Campylobacter sp.]|nr:hypothetical protein [Campylobacter sp.]